MSADPSYPMLPEQVRTRVIGWAADALPLLADPPASLKRVASFAPNRRAKLGRNMIATALETDDDFRGHLATQVIAAQGDLGHAVQEGTTPAAADPVDVAALLWLGRPDGWEARFEVIVRHLAQATPPRDEEALERLRGRLEAADEQAREQRVRNKERIDELKTENASLRRKLGEARAAQRSASEGASQTSQEAEQRAATAEASAATAEAEVRRLRAQVEELQHQLTAHRRDHRSERDQVTLRARILLDTLLDAGQGLRRELALPPVTGSPAEELEEQIGRAREGRGDQPVRRPADPMLLENYLSMPRVRLLVDGYNVSKEGWPSSSLEAQRLRLLNAMAALIARTGAETTVVFDAADITNRPMVNAPRGVKVLFSPPGVIADDVIRDLVAAEPEGRPVVVVTSDQAVARDVRRAGARVVGAGSLLGLITR
ncbi:NYN domain-containing protein [Nocardioides alcanivorans]|uniref:NYN domain-containing protein n=1 Tax=Nocardioides alcanivorans TaxID=2897352 RepID=UPI001F46D33D|nr:NYN domain-containing protein [Nocardioides alcanivorans]